MSFNHPPIWPWQFSSCWFQDLKCSAKSINKLFLNSPLSSEITTLGAPNTAIQYFMKMLKNFSFRLEFTTAAALKRVALSVICNNSTLLICFSSVENTSLNHLDMENLSIRFKLGCSYSKKFIQIFNFVNFPKFIFIYVIYSQNYPLDLFSFPIYQNCLFYHYIPFVC